MPEQERELLAFGGGAGLPVPRRRLTPAERAAWRVAHPLPPQELVHRWEDVPAFAGEDAERAWWRTHRLAPEVIERMRPVPEAEEEGER